MTRYGKNSYGKSWKNLCVSRDVKDKLIIVKPKDTRIGEFADEVLLLGIGLLEARKVSK